MSNADRIADVWCARTPFGTAPGRAAGRGRRTSSRSRADHTNPTNVGRRTVTVALLDGNQQLLQITGTLTVFP